MKKTSWSPVAVIEAMRNEKDFDQLVSQLFSDIAKQLKTKNRLIGSPVGACIFDEDLIVMRVAGYNKIYLVEAVDKEAEEFFFSELPVENNERYLAELMPMMCNADGVKAGTIQLYRGFD